MPSKYTSRRDFLKSAATIGLASTIPYYWWTDALRAKNPASKIDRIKIGLIGAGGMGTGNMMAARDWCEVVAIADVDSSHAAKANEKLSAGKANTYGDYRRILDRKDLDALHIATPDHWHTKVLVESLLAGFDVYCEKPLTLTIDEGKLIRRVLAKTNRIVQVGTQQRSTFKLFVTAIALVQAGRLGRIKRVQAAIGGAPISPAIPSVAPPKELNWDRWLGPTPVTQYRLTSVKDMKGRDQFLTNCHGDFRWWYEHSGGKLTDWGAHHVDIAMWALESNGQTEGPVSIGGEAVHPVPFKDGYPLVHDRFNTATSFKLTAAFPGGTDLIIRDDTRNGVLIEGDKGRIFVSRGKLVGEQVDALRDDPLPDGAIQKAYKGFPMIANERKAHWANFIYCLRERKEPISDVNSHMRALNVCHLAGISARLGRSINWNNESEQIVGDEQANAFLARPYRKGYEIEM
jgi:predicted dehydrogenase